MGLAMEQLCERTSSAAHIADETSPLQGATKLSPSNSFFAVAKGI